MQDCHVARCANFLPSDSKDQTFGGANCCHRVGYPPQISDSANYVSDMRTPCTFKKEMRAMRLNSHPDKAGAEVFRVASLVALASFLKVPCHCSLGKPAISRSKAVMVTVKGRPANGFDWNKRNVHVQD